MAVSGEREEITIPITNDNHEPYHRQILELLREIVAKLNDIHEELANQPTLIIDENMVDQEGSDTSFE